VAALAVKKEIDLNAVAEVHHVDPARPLLDHPAELAERTRDALTAGRALVVVF